MPGKDAVFGQAVGILSHHQINSVPCLQRKIQVAAGDDDPILPGGEGVQNPLVVMEKVQTGIVGFHGGVEAELVNAWNLAGKVAIPSVVAFLSIVDDLLESDGLACSGEVVAQSDREGNIISSMGGLRRRCGSMWPSGSCKWTKQFFSKPYSKWF